MKSSGIDPYRAMEAWVRLLGELNKTGVDIAEAMGLDPQAAEAIDAVIDSSTEYAAANVRTAEWVADVWEAKLKGKDRLDNGATVPKLSSLLTGYSAFARFIDELAAGGLQSEYLAESMTPTPEVRKVSIETAEVLAEKGYIEEPERFHQVPGELPNLSTEIVDARLFGRTVELERVSWDSTYQPDPDIPGAENTNPNNDRALAHVLRGDPDKPWLVYTHGFAMGADSDALLVQLHKVRDELGYNVMLPVFPFHGDRAIEGEPSGTGLFDANAGAMLHNIARGMEDDRAAVAWVREQIAEVGSGEPGAQKVVFLGDSLGGFRASMLSMFEENDAVIAGIAASDFSAIAAELEAQFPDYADAIRTVLTMVSPFAFETQTPEGQRFFYYGNGDAVVDPAQSIALGEHLDAEEIAYDGGHIIGPGLRTVRDRIHEILASVLGE